MLHFEDAGNPDGRVAFLIHGYMSSNLQWELNRERLGAELRLILVEQPGHGSSPSPDEADAYGPEAVFDQLERIRTDLGIDRWWAMGHSLGGAMAIRYALAHPENTAGLVFTNTRAAFGLVGDRASSPTATPRSGQPLDQTLQEDNRRGPTPERLRALPFHPIHAKRFPEDLRNRLVAGVDGMAPHVFAHIGANGAWKSREEMHRLRVPTLLVNGRWEKLFQPCVEEAADTIPDLRVVALEGGHSINIEQPEGFDRAVLDFIRSKA